MTMMRREHSDWGRRVGMAQLWIWLLLGSFMLFSPKLATAQLISPGKLAEAHAELSGIRNCMRCHTLRGGGFSHDKCLECHVPLRNRIREQKGLHATFAERNCADCHKDHFGLDFNMARFDTTEFRHDSTGFELVESHAELGCRDCHRSQLIIASDVIAYVREHGTAETTFLGVGTTCLACHEPDDPHARQFPNRSCEDCHGESVWDEPVGFDHNATRYRLTGRHRNVACEECHKPIRRRGGEPYVQYVDMAFAGCTDCHEDDHEGEMGRKCTDCHNTGGWDRLNRATFEGRFDHETTDFPLISAHADAECRGCHWPRPPDDDVHISFVAAARQQAYPPPVAEDCVSCHRDFHQGEFANAPGGIVCESCHNQSVWEPAEYDIERHNRDAAFALTGVHVATPCFACHEVAEGDQQVAVWHFDPYDCVSCHESDDPHQSQFPDTTCEDCHDDEAFTIAVFDHDNSRYPLDGEHRDVPCADCHPQETSPKGTSFARYAPLGMDCKDCHGQN